MRGFPHPWWVAGGWALDIFVGTGREHGDVDVLVRRGDQQWIRRQLPDWDVQIAHAGRLEPWPDGHDVDLPRSGFWARSDPDGPWQLQFLLGDHEADEWWYRRDPSIRMPLGEIGRVSASGIRTFAPSSCCSTNLGSTDRAMLRTSSARCRSSTTTRASALRHGCRRITCGARACARSARRARVSGSEPQSLFAAQTVQTAPVS
jgi:hypothetical protein